MVSKVNFVDIRIYNIYRRRLEDGLTEEDYCNMCVGTLFTFFREI